MRIQDRPEFTSKPKPLSFTGETTVAEAVAAMSEKNFGSVMVVDDESRLVGVVTERDVMKKLVNQNRDATSTKLSDIMTSELRTAKVDDDYRDWLRVMSNERFRRLPIVSEDNKVLAVMTQGDFVSYSWPDLLYRTQEAAKETLSRNSQFALIVGALMAYTIVMVIVLGVFG
ncbi:MAG: CBS domain-containing protein [Pseudomonadota bacterium]